MRARLPSTDRRDFRSSLTVNQPKPFASPKILAAATPSRKNSYALDADIDKYAPHKSPFKAILLKHSKSLITLFCFALLLSALIISILFNLKHLGYIDSYIETNHHDGDEVPHDDIIIKHHNPHTTENEEQDHSINTLRKLIAEAPMHEMHARVDVVPSHMSDHYQYKTITSKKVASVEKTESKDNLLNSMQTGVSEKNAMEETSAIISEEKSFEASTAAAEFAGKVDEKSKTKFATRTETEPKSKSDVKSSDLEAVGRMVLKPKGAGFRQWTPVPRIVHFIFGLKEDASKVFFRFRHYLAIKAAFDLIKPDKIMLHYAVAPVGTAWTMAQQMVSDLVQVDLKKYQEMNGKPVKTFTHASDLLRLDILIEHGGIYLDIDVIVLKPFEDFLTQPCTLAELKPEKSLSNSVIVAKPNVKFLRDWKAAYEKDFNDEEVNKHSAFVPMNLAKWRKFEGVNVLKQDKFYTPSSLNELYMSNTLDLSSMYAVHLHASDMNQDRDGTLSQVCALQNSYGRVLRAALLAADAKACELFAPGLTLENQLKPSGAQEKTH